MLLFFTCLRVVYKAKINPLGIDNDIVNLGAYTFQLLFKQLQVHQESTPSPLSWVSIEAKPWSTFSHWSSSFFHSFPFLVLPHAAMIKSNPQQHPHQLTNHPWLGVRFCTPRKPGHFSSTIKRGTRRERRTPRTWPAGRRLSQWCFQRVSFPLLAPLLAITWSLTWLHFTAISPRHQNPSYLNYSVSLHRM